jgi:hypothetical protein
LGGYCLKAISPDPPSVVIANKSLGIGRSHRRLNTGWAEPTGVHVDAEGKAGFVAGLGASSCQYIRGQAKRMNPM